LWPNAEWLFSLGRLTFPLFCLGIAVNIARSPAGDLYTESNARYLIWMTVFAVISELPFRLLSSDSGTLNVMYSLMLGLLIVWGVHHRGRDGLLLVVVSVGVAVLIRERLMYGVFGALLPAALLLAIRRPGLLWLLPAVLCVLANCRNRWVEEWDQPVFGALILLVAFVAPMLGLWLLRSANDLKVWAVRRWGYWFYPGHLTALYMIELVV
ncbi:TraX family protein, partial [Pseudomonas sp. HR1]|uniref:TraX family protein n=1 Tax=Pseudomonas sp. HR1 TaxID=1463361 RepID=UPI002543B3A0